MITEKYRCEHCGYVYVYMKYDNGNELNKAFSDLDENWLCPTCGLNKSHFKKLEL